MALTIKEAQDREQLGESYTVDRRLWLTKDKSRVVEDGDTEAAFLFVAPGRMLSANRAREYGLRYEDGKVVLPSAVQPAPAKAPEPPQKPEAPKARTKPEDKARSKRKEK